MKKLIILNLVIWISYLFANFVALSYIDTRINTNFTAPFSVFSMYENYYNVVNLGTSHGEVGFSWDNIEHEKDSVRGLNLGLSGKPLKYDYFLLDYYKSAIDSEAIIILPLSFHTLCMTSETYSPIDSVYNVTLPLLGMVRLNYLWDLYSYPRPFPNDDFKDDYVAGLIIPEDCDEITIQKSLGHIEEIYSLFPNLVLVTTPYYYDALGQEEHFSEFYNTIHLISSILNISYFDYSRDDRFNDRSLFYDVTHLNSLGRDLFTSIVIDEIIVEYRSNTAK